MKFVMIKTIVVFMIFNDGLCTKFNLSSDYDSERIPQKPLAMKSNFIIHAVTSMNTDSRTFGLDVTLKQRWKDYRISMNNSRAKLHYKTTDIWLPEYFVYHATNQRRAYVTIELSNTTGVVTVKKTTHFMIDIGCAMNFTDFPNDKQECYLALYTNDYNETEISMTTKVVSAASPKYLQVSDWNVDIIEGNFTPYTNVSTTGITISILH